MGKKRAKGVETSAASAADGPRLLSGGNPQIPKGDGRPPVQAYLDAMPGWKGEVGRRLDGLIVRGVPQLRQALRWNQPFYGGPGGGWFLCMHCLTRYVKVALLNGAALDPLPPVGSKRKGIRYVHLFEDEPFDEALLTRWIEQASTLPGETWF